MGGRAPPRKSRGPLEDIVGAFGFREFGSQPAVFCFQVDRLGRCSGPGFFVLADPDPQGFFTDAELVGDAGDCATSGDGIGLGVEHEFNGALFELWGVFDGHVGGSFSNFLPSIKPGANHFFET